MVNNEALRIEKEIELLRFRYNISERYAHTIFNAYFLRQGKILGAFLTIFISLLTINLSQKGLFYLNLFLLMIVLLAGSYALYEHRIRGVRRDLIKLEGVIEDKYVRLNDVLG